MRLLLRGRCLVNRGLGGGLGLVRRLRGSRRAMHRRRHAYPGVSAHRRLRRARRFRVAERHHRAGKGEHEHQPCYGGDPDRRADGEAHGIPPAARRRLTRIRSLRRCTFPG